MGLIDIVLIEFLIFTIFVLEPHDRDCDIICIVIISIFIFVIKYACSQ